ncbi:MAG: hypothetical protein ACP5GZ_10135 [Vulcanisaeta sp.]|jgi:hypothetical protein|uniref:hypothetical protein n=1 Tax=Vulcanisaeta sp. TaxID=2020871 RepID=UPI003D0AB2BC
MSAWELGGLVYRELIVQAITQVRRTGARPVRIERIISGYGIIKAVASLMIISYLAAPLIIGLITHWRTLVNMYQSPPYEYLTMYFMILLIYMLLSPIVTSVMGYPTIGDLLRTLSLNEDFIRLISIIAIVRAVDAPLASSIITAIIVSVIIHTPSPVLITAQALLLGLVGPLMGIVALDTVVRRRGSASAFLTRSLIVTTNSIPWVIALTLLMLSEDSAIISPGIAQYVPLISDPFITNHQTALMNSVITTIMLLTIDTYLLINAGPRLLRPRIPGGPESLITINKPFRGFRFRGVFTGLVRYYMRQVLSARGSLGMFIGGLLMAVFLYTSLATSMNELTQFELMIGIMAYAAPLAFITSFLPVMMYNAEYSALPIILTIPITPIRRMLAKIPMALMTYYILTAPIIVILTALGHVMAIPPVLALAVSPLASTVMSAVIFQLEVRDYLNGSQALAILNLVNTILIVITTAVPMMTFIVVQVITMNITYSTTTLVITGTAETAALTLLLIGLVKR